MTVDILTLVCDEEILLLNKLIFKSLAQIDKPKIRENINTIHYNKLISSLVRMDKLV